MVWGAPGIVVLYLFCLHQTADVWHFWPHCFRHVLIFFLGFWLRPSRGWGWTPFGWSKPPAGTFLEIIFDRLYWWLDSLLCNKKLQSNVSNVDYDSFDSYSGHVSESCPSNMCCFLKMRSMLSLLIVVLLISLNIFGCEEPYPLAKMRRMSVVWCVSFTDWKHSMKKCNLAWVYLIKKPIMNFFGNGRRAWRLWARHSYDSY